MCHKRERMPKVKQVPHPLPPPVLGDSSIKGFHVYKGMIPLHIYDKYLKPRLQWDLLHDFKILMQSKFWVVISSIFYKTISSSFTNILSYSVGIIKNKQKNYKMLYRVPVGSFKYIEMTIKF